MKKIKLPEYKKIKLDNGLIVFLMKYTKLPLVNFRFLLRRGSVYDSPGKEGLARITASLLKKGTSHLNAIEIFNEIDLLGGEIECSADLDYSIAVGEFLSKNWDKGFDIFTDIILNPVFDEKEVERKKKKTLGEVIARKDNPGIVANLHFSKFLFKENPYGKPISGTESSINNITRNDIINFYNKHYSPENSILVIAGDFEEEKAMNKLYSTLSKWTANPDKDKPVVKSPSLEGINILIVDKPDLTQSQIRLGNVGINKNSDDYFAVRVMSNILGGGFNSRLNNEVRVKRGLTYGITSRFNTPLYPGEFVISTFTKNKTILETIEIILGEIKKIRTENVFEKELKGSQKYITGLYPLSIETLELMSKQLTDIEFFGLDDKYVENYRKNTLSVGIDDVKYSAQKYLQTDNLAVVAVSNMKEIKKDLEKLGKVVCKSYKDEL